MSAVWESLVRTFTPIIVGAVLGWFTAAGINLDGEFEGAITLLISGVLSGVYYVAVRLLETYVAPKFGWLLGLAKTPEYTKHTTWSDAERAEQYARDADVDAFNTEHP